MNTLISEKHVRQESDAGRVRSVLFVTTSFPRFENDFCGSFVFRFAKYLVRDGLQVIVLAPDDGTVQQDEMIEGVSISRFTYFWPRNLQRLAYGTGGGITENIRRSMLALFQVPCLMLAMSFSVWRHQKHVDLIHCHWLPTVVAALFARAVGFSKTPIVFTNWGTDTRRFPRRILRMILGRVDGVLSVSVETERHLEQAGYREFTHTEIPIDEQRFDPKSVDDDLRDELKIPADVGVVAFVARLTPFKDPLTFLSACQELRARGIAFHAVIAGDGDLFEVCHEFVTKTGLGDCVQLLGMRDDTERVLRIAAVSIHISPVDNVWSSTIAEAMLMRVPVVLSDAGCTSEVFAHGDNCLLVPPQDPSALADAIQQMLGDTSLQARLRDGGLRLLRDSRKDNHHIIADTRAFYESVIFERGSLSDRR